MDTTPAAWTFLSWASARSVNIVTSSVRRRMFWNKRPNFIAEGSGENGSEKLGHGSGGMELLRAA